MHMFCFSVVPRTMLAPFRHGGEATCRSYVSLHTLLQVTSTSRLVPIVLTLLRHALDATCRSCLSLHMLR